MQFRDPSQPHSKTEQVLGWGVVSLLLAGCLLVMLPFVSAMLWAIVLCFTTWPLYRRLKKKLGQRGTLAAVLMGLGMVLILLVPILIVGSTLADNVKDLTVAAKRFVEQGPPPPPAWLAKVPLAGQKLVTSWQDLAQDTAKLWKEAQRLIEPVSAGLLKLGLMLGAGLMQLTLSILVAVFLYRDGESMGERLVTMVDRIGDERGRQLLTLAGNTIRGVVYGILGTALVQAVLAGIGYLVSGVPGTGVLSLLTFFAAIVPIVGTALVWVPAAIYLFLQGSTGWGIFLVIWGIGVNNVDNVLKPILISKGSNMPFLLIFFGVLGGAVAFGFIGVFLGPTLLALGYQMIEQWSKSPATAEPSAAASGRAATEAVPAAVTVGGNGGDS
jgi:predicted PurR-regulated permease PerM